MGYNNLTSCLLCKEFLFALLVLYSLSSCNGSEQKQIVEALSYKVDSLSSVIASKDKDIESLSNELNQYKYSPEKLYANAKDLFRERESAQLNKILSQLQSYHPESPQIDTIKFYIQDIERQIKEDEAKEQEEKLSCLNSLQKNVDDVSGTTWYKTKTFRHDVNRTRTSIYIGKTSSSTWLRLKMSYGGDDWIFFEDAYLSYDGNTYKIPFNKYKDKKTDNAYGDVWEWIDVPVDEALHSYLLEFANGKSQKMRLSGKYSETRTLSVAEIKGIQQVLIGYEILKNM